MLKTFTMQLCFSLCVLFVPLVLGRLPPGREYARRHPNTNPNHPMYGDLWQGDIKLKNIHDAENQKPSNLNAIWDKTLRWSNNIVPYSIRTSDFTQPQLERIYEGIDRLQNLVMVGGQNCLTFVERSSESNYIDVFNENGCWSWVGMLGGRQELSLDNGCHSLGTIMHEFLHALGFYHEQSREDRDDFVTIVWDNIIPGYEYNFDKYEEGVDIDHLGTPYDYDSVMHYHAYAFALDPSQPTIIPHDPDADIGITDDLSPIDIERVQILYECLDVRDSKYFKHLAKKIL